MNCNQDVGAICAGEAEVPEGDRGQPLPENRMIFDAKNAELFAGRHLWVLGAV